MPTIASLSGLKFTQIDVTGLPGREITLPQKSAHQMVLLGYSFHLGHGTGIESKTLT